MRSYMVGGVDEFVDVSDGDGRFGFSFVDRVGVVGGAGLERSFVSRRVSVANPHGVGADEWAHIHVWL